MPRDSSNQFIEVRAERFEGAPANVRRRWSEDFKERAVAAALEPEVNISALARSLDISPSQLFGWRRAAAKRASDKAPMKPPGEQRSARSKRVEIEIGGAVVRVGADIAEDDLRRLLRAVREL
jgi:transposase